MNRFIFILLIAILPLRGWTGVAMATEMAAINLAATKAANTQARADLEVVSSMPNCDMSKAKAGDFTTAKPLCTHCQTCHATGFVSTVQITSFDKVLYAQPLTQSRQFASANLAHSQKPPIL